MRWCIEVELTYEIEEGDTGAEKDCHGPELDRAKAKLNTILDGKPFVHFHVLRHPRKVYD